MSAESNASFLAESGADEHQQSPGTKESKDGLPEQDNAKDLETLSSATPTAAQYLKATLHGKESGAYSEWIPDWDLPVVFRWIGIALVSILILAVILLLSLQRKTGLNEVFLHLHCETAGCVEHMELLNRTLRQDLSPCDDFEGFVCSGWKAQSLSRVNVAADMRWKWLAYINHLFINGTLKMPRSIKARASFKSCLGRPEEISGKHLEQLKNFMRDRGIPWPSKPAPDRHPVDVLLDLDINWRCSLWLRTRFVLDKSRRTVHISPRKPPALSIEPSFESNEPSKPGRDFLQDTISLMKLFHGIYGQPYDPAVTKVSADIHVEIVKGLFTAFQSGRNNRARVQLKDISRLTPSINADTWLQSLQKHTSFVFNLTIDSDVYVQNNETLETLDLSVKKHSVEDLLNVIGWHFVLRYTSVLAKTVPSVTDDFKDKQFSTVCEQQLSEMYGALPFFEYAQEKFPLEHKIKISRFLNNIKSRVIAKLQGSEASKNLKGETLDQLSKLKFDVWPSNAIGGILKDTFPGNEASFIDFWIGTRKASRSLLGTQEYDDLFNGRDHSDPPFSYRSNDNVLLISMELLSSPLYYIDVPGPVMYGGLGATLAGQIVRTFYTDADSNSCGDPGLQVAFDMLGLEGPGVMSLKAARGAFFLAYCVSRCGSQNSTCNSATRSFKPFATTFSCGSSSHMGGDKTCTFF